jgi:hypothetical protein
MTEQTTHLGDATVEPRKDVPIRYREVVTGSPQAIIELHADFREVKPQHGGKSLTERFNEAYDEEAKRDDEEFVKNLKRYHRRRFSDEW